MTPFHTLICTYFMHDPLDPHTETPAHMVHMILAIWIILVIQKVPVVRFTKALHLYSGHTVCKCIDLRRYKVTLRWRWMRRRRPMKFPVGIMWCPHLSCTLTAAKRFSMFSLGSGRIRLPDSMIQIHCVYKLGTSVLTLGITRSLWDGDGCDGCSQWSSKWA